MELIQKIILLQEVLIIHQEKAEHKQQVEKECRKAPLVKVVL